MFMARSVDTRKPDVVEVDDRGSYKRRWTGKAPLVFIMILALVAIRLYQDRGSEVFGKRMNAGEAEPRTTPTPHIEITPTPLTEITPTPHIEIKTAPVAPPDVVVEEPPRAVAKPPRVAGEPHRVVSRPRRVAGEPPRIAVEREPALTTELKSDIMGYARIIAENANLREGPGIQYRLISVLPRNLEVAVLRQLHINTNGEAWVEVLAAPIRDGERGG